MTALQASGHTSAWVTTGVQDMAPVVVDSLVEEGLNAGLHVAPASSVERLLLTEDDVLGVGVAVEVLLQLLPGEGVHLFDTGDGGVPDTVRLTMLGESSPDLTGAHNHTLDFLRLVNLFAMLVVRDNPAEMGVASELLDGGSATWVTEKGFREENDQCY